jgi:hypothetical protein
MLQHKTQHHTAGPTHHPQPAQALAPPHPTAIIQRAQMNPGSLMPGDVLQLQRTIGNRAVGQLLQRARQGHAVPPLQAKRMDGLIQRKGGQTAKEKGYKRQYRRLKEKIENKEETAPESPDFKLSIVLHTDTEVRSKGSNLENGHSWVEVERLKPWAEVSDTAKGAMEEVTRNLLEKVGWTSMGFYPSHAQGDVKGMIGNVFGISEPGVLREPEKGGIIQTTPTAKKNFLATGDQAANLFRYVNRKRDANYNFLSYNCTTFATKAIAAAGFSANEYLGKVTSKGVASPNKLYKRLFEQAALGDKSVEINKGLSQGERHLDKVSGRALTAVGGKSLQDLVGGMEGIAGRSAAFEAINEALFADKQRMNRPPQPQEPGSPPPVPQRAKGLIEILAPQWWKLKNSIKTLTKPEKRMLLAIYADKFTPEVLNNFVELMKAKIKEERAKQTKQNEDEVECTAEEIESLEYFANL